jgi:hypothetical protein
MQQNSTLSKNFPAFVWQDKSNRRLLLIAAVATLLQFIIFKFLYPFPDFFSDSYSYIYAASVNQDVSIWPIGYSKFLAAFHTLTHSDTALVAFQYFLLETSSLWFFFTVTYFSDLGNVGRKIFFVFLFFNPFFLYLSNYVNSDSLFAAVSLLWFTELLWIVYRPRRYQLFTHGMLLVLCFTIRNNAYYYPFVSIAAYAMSHQPLKQKIAGLLLPLLFIGGFVLYTREAAFKLTGTRQFSLFTGWQLANNALYLYDKIEVDSTKLPTKEAKDLHQESIKFFKKVDPVKYREYLEDFVGNFFIKSADAPMKQYFFRHYRMDTREELVVSWGQASADFSPFGKYIIMHHPLAYARYFVWPNVFHYFNPPLSVQEIYNYGRPEIDSVAQQWFDYKTDKVWCVSYSLQEFLLVYAALFLLVNLYYIVLLTRFLVRTGAKRSALLAEPGVVVVLIFTLLNFLFTIGVTTNVLRYQTVPMTILFAGTLALNELLARLPRVAAGPSKKVIQQQIKTV